MGQALWTALLAVSSRGINPGETPEQAMYRELFEEVGLNKRMFGYWLQPVIGCVTNYQTFGALGYKAGVYRPKTAVVLTTVNV